MPIREIILKRPTDTVGPSEDKDSDKEVLQGSHSTGKNTLSQETETETETEQSDSD